MVGRHARAAAPVLWAAGLVAVAQSTLAVQAWPALGLLRGPLAPALLGLALAAALLPYATPALERRVARVRAWTLTAGAFAVFAAAGLYYAERLHPSGDEPHYLLMAQSLWREGDLDLRDNFARGDFREYLPALEAPHYGAPRADGRPFPSHSPGLPALLAPVYALGGRRASVLVMALLAAACASQARGLARRLGASEQASAFAFLAACGPPLGFYAFHLYTEVPSALALAVSLRLLSSAPAGTATAGPAPDGRPRSVVTGALAALASSSLPWLHVKMVPAAAALGLLALWRLRGRALAAFLVVAGLAALGFAAYYESVFGRATPLGLFGGGVPRGVGPAPLRAAAGLLLDRSFGLLPHAPVFVLALAGAPLLLRRLVAREATEARAAVTAHVIVLAAVLAPVLAWRMWWGGMCPPARFLVPVVPSLAALTALRLSRDRGAAGHAARPGATDRGLARWRWPLLAAGVALAAFMTARPADLLLLNRRDRPTRVWEALAGHTPAGTVSLGDYLPSLVLFSPSEARKAAMCLGGLLALLLLDTRAGGRATPARGAGAPARPQDARGPTA